jgi:hypothetical protein
MKPSTFSIAVFLIFMTLKLAGFIDWSWWAVTAPLWIGLPLQLVIAIALYLYIVRYGTDQQKLSLKMRGL